jgi:methionyl-tRNA synthetase
VRDEYDGFAPERAEPTANQARFAAEVGALAAAADRAYRQESFSPRRVCAALNQLVDAAAAFGAGESHWRRGAVDQRRTAAALELGAAATLAALVTPLMPGFGARLWSELGFSAPLRPGDWPAAAPVTVPPGQRLSGLNAPYFAGIEAGCDALAAARAPASAMAAA